ncbi:MAG: MotA/TolQ/ExbB proton channel family protein [Verrucomicrobiae bacterium]|nr:MotA/TolQ/ExbB proton channel family protein [Verrucomicrobiae bacterium]MCB1233832.1 MotA/TolQ/ExbB proton channel family protein [Verrucomicrobiae bacterium]
MKFPSSLFAALIAIFLIESPLFTLAQEDLTIPGVDDKKVEAPQVEADEGADAGEKNLFDLILEGGWAMWPLGAMSIAIIALAVYCFLDLAPKNFYPPELVEKLATSMENGDVEAAMKTAEASPTCLGQVMYGATEYIYERGYETLDGDTIYDLMADASQEFNRARARTINYFSVISQAAPMLGLLGTVSGMIKAFGTLGREGMGDPTKLASNISEALVTTATGLVIALPAIFAYFFFRDKLSAHVAQVDKHASRMLNNLRRAVYTGTFDHGSGASGGGGPTQEGPPMA